MATPLFSYLKQTDFGGQQLLGYAPGDDRVALVTQAYGATDGCRLLAVTADGATAYTADILFPLRAAITAAFLPILLKKQKMRKLIPRPPSTICRKVMNGKLTTKLSVG